MTQLSPVVQCGANAQAWGLEAQKSGLSWLSQLGSWRVVCLGAESLNSHPVSEHGCEQAGDTALPLVPSPTTLGPVYVPPALGFLVPPTAR